MSKNKILIYDFDGTITSQESPFYPIVSSSRNQEYEEFLSNINIHKLENNLAYADAFVEIMTKEFKTGNSKYETINFELFGKNVEYRKGIDSFFENIRKEAEKSKADVKNYMVSSGFREYLNSLEISKEFEGIYASSLKLSKDNKILGMDFVMTDIDKIDAIKEIMNKSDVKGEDVAYFGDGLTDKHAMEYVKSLGGISIYVYEKGDAELNEDFKKAITHYLIADYTKGSELYNTVIDFLNS